MEGGVPVVVGLLKTSGVSVGGGTFFPTLPLGPFVRLRHRLILAADLTDVDRARAVVQAVGDRVDAIKVNWPLVLVGGLGIVRGLMAFVGHASRQEHPLQSLKIGAMWTSLPSRQRHKIL